MFLACNAYILLSAYFDLNYSLSLSLKHCNLSQINSSLELDSLHLKVKWKGSLSMTNA